MTRPPASIAADLANRALAGEAWARDKLAAHAGRIFALESGPVAAAFAIGEDGSFAAAPSGVAPALALVVSPLGLPALAAEPSRWSSLVRIEGDAALAATLEELALTIPWFVERAFCAALGPFVGPKVADAGRLLLTLPGEVSRRAAGSLGDFAGEADLVATRRDLASLADGARDADSRVAALEARVERLAAAIEQTGRPKVT